MSDGASTDPPRGPAAAPAREVPGPPPAAAPTAERDMHDEPGETDKYASRLRDALAHFEQEHSRFFRENDEAALWEQKTHRRIVRFLSVSGTLAVVFSILHLTRLLPLEKHPELIRALAIGLFVGEGVAVLVAAVAAVAGVVHASQRRWLERRHKAERMRMLKFRRLLDPALVSPGEEGIEDWQARLAQEVEEIRPIDRRLLHEWVKEVRPPDIPLRPPEGGIDAAAVADVLDYYRRKRVDYQARYFKKQAERNQRWDWATRWLPPGLFVLSVLFALLHLIGEVREITAEGMENYLATWARPWTEETGTYGLWYIILAAILPAVGAGFRGYRSAYEFSRNTLRFRALQFALEKLQRALDNPDADPEEVWRDLWWCELLLEAEHREWLRLMIEAEWLG